MNEPHMPWTELVTYSESHNLLAKQLWVVFSEAINGLGPVLENLDEHVAHQTDLENRGIMFAAGPFASDDEQEWEGHGMFIYRARSMEEARGIAEDDPMHVNGARRFRVRPWLLNEGSYTVRVSYSGSRATVE